MIAVEVAEDVLPVGDVLPEAGELVEADGPAPIRVLGNMSAYRDCGGGGRTKIVIRSFTVSRSNAVRLVNTRRSAQQQKSTHESNLR